MAKVNVKNPLSLILMTDATAEKMHRVTAVGVKSVKHSNHRKGDDIRGENSSSYDQKPNLIAASQHEPPYRMSEEKAEFRLDYAGPRIHPPSHN
jgi:hypothetical protein